MAAVGKLTIEIQKGPALRAALDVLDLASDLLDLIPEWHAKERGELLGRANALLEIATNELKK